MSALEPMKSITKQEADRIAEEAARRCLDRLDDFNKRHPHRGAERRLARIRDSLSMSFISIMHSILAERFVIVETPAEGNKSEID